MGFRMLAILRSEIKLKCIAKLMVMPCSEDLLIVFSTSYIKYSVIWTVSYANWIIAAKQYWAKIDCIGYTFDNIANIGMKLCHKIGIFTLF